MNGQDEIPEITVLELKQRLDADQPIALVDVREPYEWDIADLPEVGQLRIPLAEFEQRQDELDRDDSFVIYCRSGARSGSVVQYLRAAGYQNVWNLRGGILAWREEIDPTLQAY